jgi:hypothetical protein
MFVRSKEFEVAILSGADGETVDGEIVDGETVDGAKADGSEWTAGSAGGETGDVEEANTTPVGSLGVGLFAIGFTGGAVGCGM